MSDRAGQDFQDLVAMLERALQGETGVEIRSPAMLLDKDTGRPREHDVVIFRTTHHGRSITAVECRDRSRKVTVDQVEGFAKKCERTGVHHGVIVSSKGFAQTARDKAGSLNVSCVGLTEAQGFPWIQTSFLIGRVFNFVGLQAAVAVDDPGRNAQEPYTLIDILGEEVGSHFLRI